jgi:hypothetical protein
LTFVSGVHYNSAMFKSYWYGCTNCDASIEVVSKGIHYQDPTCNCHDSNVVWCQTSVVESEPTNERQQMETKTTAPQTMTLDWVENDVVTNKTYTESDIRNMVWVNKNLTNKQSEWYKKESQLRTLLEEVYADSSDQETLAQIAEIFDVPLTKEIEVTAWVRVDMTIEVDMADGDYDIESLVSDNLTIDSYGSEISVNNYEVDRVEEGAY